MAITGYTHQTPSSTADRLLKIAGAGFARLAVMWRAARNRRSVARLLEWDAHMLRDIGVTPGDVQSALASPLAEDPSYRLGVMSVERRAAFRATAHERLARQANRVASKSETLAAGHRRERRVPPNRILDF